VPGEIGSARLHITALGLYQAEINGHAVTDDIFRPGWTSYRHRLCYRTYEVTPLIQGRA
jgi:alpha-L-rhamnosidase